MSLKKHWWLIFVSSLVLLITSIILYTVLIKKKSKEISETPLILTTPPLLADFQPKETLINAIEKSLLYLNRLPADTSFIYGNLTIPKERIINTLEDFIAKLNILGFSTDFFSYINANYLFFKANTDNVLCTGYYEASLNGSKTKNAIYSYPLYRKPDDLITLNKNDFPILKDNKDFPAVIRGRLAENNRLLPYYSRQEIDSGKKLFDRNLELVWIDNPIDIFFLQIQGSGIVQLDSGELMRVNYHEANGHPYRAIGRWLVEKNIYTLEEISMQKIRQYLQENPAEMAEIMNYNASYVFFREVEEGPIGAINVPLTPYRSIALDRSLFPLGGLCFIRTEFPQFDRSNQFTGSRPFQGFMLCQDTGGAIKTPSRMDIFMGFGPKNEHIAGHMKHPGMFYFMLKKIDNQ
jgi:membrane-bound lytic murein transglycosylase A